MDKEILIVLPGQLNFFSKKNYDYIKKLFKCKINFFICPWEDTNYKKIKKFKIIYNPIKIKKIKKKNFTNELKKIKYPDPEGNPVGTMYMWDSIEKSLKEIYKFYKFKKKPDYIIRYRSDILPINNKKLQFLEKIRSKNILVPDRFHWNGINDQFFIFSYLDIKLFFDLNKFISNFIKKDRFFSSEYIFQQFLKTKKIKIKYSTFNYKIMRFQKNNKKSLNIVCRKKLIDLINCKINKLRYKFRNFNNYYIKKKYLNKNQEIIIK